MQSHRAQSTVVSSRRTIQLLFIQIELFTVLNMKQDVMMLLKHFELLEKNRG